MPNAVADAQKTSSSESSQLLPSPPPIAFVSRLSPLFRMTLLVIFVVDFGPPVRALILSGGPDCFARYPKWAQTFENELSLEFKTRLPNALLLYTDDGAMQLNFFSVSILEGHVQVEFRLGEPQPQQLVPVERPLIRIGLPESRVDDGRWHRLNFFQAWENVKVQLDEEAAFRVLDQRSFTLGNIRTNSDVFVGGIPKEVERLSSPLRRHSHRFAGSVRNLFYRIYPQGMSTPQLMDSLGTRKTDEDYCQQQQQHSPMASQASRLLGQQQRHGNNNNDSNSSNNNHNHNSLDYCQHGGRCYSANNGPRCDCGFSEYEGRRCEIKKPSTEVSFFGNEWLGYDMRTIGERGAEEKNSSSSSQTTPEFLAVWSRREVYNITFRTNYSSSIIFVAGDSKSHVKLLLEKGVILAQSRLADTEKRIIRVQDRARRRVHLDDGLWHSVCLIRELSSPGLKSAVFSMRLIVDDFFDQDVRQFVHEEPWLGNSFLFLGGVPRSLAPMVPEHLFPFRGCIKRAFFQSGPIQLNMIQLADQGFGQSSVQTFGDLSYSCAPNAQTPEVFSFNSGHNFTKLPAWRSPARGTLAFQFRTLLPEGLLLYHGMANCKNFTICDYLAFELVDAHLMMVINLGSGDIRLQASSTAMNDGQWHSVVMERSGRRGVVTVDSLRTDFSCPGISANLNIEEPIFLGAVPWSSPFQPKPIGPEPVTVIELLEAEQQPAISFPSAVWSIGLRQGFVGCLKNVRVNGINAEIAHAFQAKLNGTGGGGGKVGSSSSGKGAREPISVGCPFSFAANFCAAKTGAKAAGGPCKNEGVCSSTHSGFRCDCANSLFDGLTCQQKPRLVPFPLAFPFMAHFALAGGWQSESENLELKFRLRLGPNDNLPPRGQHGLFVLMDTKTNAEEAKDRMLVALLGAAGGGLLAHWVFGSGEQRVLHWTGNISTPMADHWHSVKIRRRGRAVGLFLDGQWSNHLLPTQSPKISIDELAIGLPIGPHRIKDKPEHLFRFHGELRHFTLNGHDLLKPIRGRRQTGDSSRQHQQQQPAADNPEEKEEAAAVDSEHRRWQFHQLTTASSAEKTATTTTTAMLLLHEQQQLLAHHEQHLGGGVGRYNNQLIPARQPDDDDPFLVDPHRHRIKQQQQPLAPAHSIGPGGSAIGGLANGDDDDDSSSFFSKAPLGCLRQQSAGSSCEPGPLPEDSFFTPIVSKPFQRVTATAATSSSTSSSRSTTTATATTSPTTQKTATTRTVAASTSRTFPRSEDLSAAGSKTVAPPPKSLSSSSSAASTKMPPAASHQQLLAQRLRAGASNNNKNNNKGYYEPAGGWPVRTRTWPDGRRLGSDGVRKWQKLKPPAAGSKDKSAENPSRGWQATDSGKSSYRPSTTTPMPTTTTTMKARTTTTTASSTSTTASSTSTTKRPATTSTTAQQQQQPLLVTVDPAVKPGLRFTFAPTSSSTAKAKSSQQQQQQQQQQQGRDSSSIGIGSSSSTLAPRFPVHPDDPTLYAVRPTTPMNGFGQQQPQAPTPMGPSTSTNQLGLEKKILIGVGSLCIVLLIGAILLCCFCKCKRCSHLYSRFMNWIGASPPTAPGLKAGYAPIPPNEFASPQLGGTAAAQHHPMQNFEHNNGTRAGNAGNLGTTSSATLLRNGGGGGTLGNGIPAAATATAQQQQTRVVLANGNGGGLRETTSLVNTTTREAQQRKRQFKEWYV